MSVALSCSLCSTGVEIPVEIPEGWKIPGGTIDEEDALCPKHAEVIGFREAQCPGCVGGWGQCGLWDAFAYSGKRAITPAHLDTIRAGICPFRVNGTFGVTNGQFVDIDLSDRAPDASGVVLAQAIVDYIEEYPA